MLAAAVFTGGAALAAGSLPAVARGAARGVPALLVIGQVAALGSTLGWFNSEPLMQTAA